MKRIWKDLLAHVKGDVKNRGFLPALLFTAILVAVNYGFDLEHQLLVKFDSVQYMLYFLVVYPLVYYPVVWMLRGREAFRSAEFLKRSGLFILLISLVSGFSFHEDWVRDLPLYERFFLKGVLSQLVGPVILFLPVMLYYHFLQKRELDGFYGLSLRNHNFKPYLWLILLMIPLITSAATQQDFLSAYPTFKPWKYQSAFGLHPNQMTAIFETVYLLDFIRVEFAFRGLLVIGLASLLGKETVLSMSVLYCVLHFNKPLGETISSLFGGYILGTIAYHQKNIVGGCIVHAGIAGLMELIAFAAHRWL